MKKLTRILSLFLVMAMLLSSLAACKDDGDDNSGDEGQGAVDSTLLTVADYKVVYARGLSNTLVTKISELQYEIEKRTGSKPLSEKDTSRNEVDDENFEILIGDTSRVQSDTALAKLNGKAGFVIARYGNKVAINGSSDYMLEKGIQHFVSKVLKDSEKGSGAIKMAEDFLYSNTSMSSVRFLGGIGGALRYKIVYSKDVDTDPSHEYAKGESEFDVDYTWTQVQSFLEIFSTLTGKTVSPVTDSASEDSTYIEILIGHTNRQISKDLYDKMGANEYGILCRGNQIAIGSWADSNLPHAFNYFKELVEYCRSYNGNAVYLPSDSLLSQRFHMFAENIPEFKGGTLAGVMDSATGTLKTGNETGTLQQCYKNTTVTHFNDYCTKLQNAGYTVYFENSNKNTDNNKTNYFKTYVNDTNMVHVYFTASLGMTRVVSAKLENINLPTVKMESYQKVTEPKMTQMRFAYDTNTFGMCYIFTLEDGSFIVFDGGDDGGPLLGVDYPYSNDHIRLYDILTSLNKREDKKIVIAAWIITHQHGDHFTNFVRFAENYGKREDVVVEKCITNFASRAAFYNTHDPYASSMNALYYVSGQLHTPFTLVEVHTGQNVWVRNVMVEVLYTQEDMYPDPLMVFNNSSVVTRLHVNKTNGNGAIQSTQTVMMLGDIHYEGALRMQEMYGEDAKSSAFLKSDVVQVSHHGCNGATFELYRVIAPSVVFFPASQAQYNARIKSTYGQTFNIKGKSYKEGQVNSQLVALSSIVKDGSGNKAIKAADVYNWTLHFPFAANSIGNYLKNNTVPAGPSGNGAYPAS